MHTMCTLCTRVAVQINVCHPFFYKLTKKAIKSVVRKPDLE